MLKVPKNSVKNIYNAPKYMIEELDKRLNEAIEKLDKSSDLYILLKQISETSDINYIKIFIEYFILNKLKIILF